MNSVPKFINPIEFLTERQKDFYDSIGEKDNHIIMAHGLAGCGKSFIAIQRGLEMVLSKEFPTIKNLLVIKPTVDVGSEDKLGFLPGQLEEKMNQHFESVQYIMKSVMKPEHLDNLFNRGKVEFKVVNFMRGMNLNNCFIIIDEAQNLSLLQLKTICTRINDNTKVCILGDMSQCDKFKDYRRSGFYDIWFRYAEIAGVHQMQFSPKDCIRSGIVKSILETYETDQYVNLEKID